MPIGEAFGNLGTERDGSPSGEYCSFCYRNGAFTLPGLTVGDMIRLSIDNMTGDLGMPLEEASEVANRVIPSLRRWSES
jgi:Putative zinc ribbon domain